MRRALRNDRASVARVGRSRGFTLVELLVVIAIIGLLAALTTAAGVAIVGRQKVNATQNLLKTLDRALEDYLATTNGVAPKYVVDAGGNPTQYDRVPGADVVPNDGANALPSGAAFVKYPASSNVRHSRFPDAAVFLKQAKGFGAVDSIVTQISPRFLVITVGERVGVDPMNDIAKDVTPSVLDSWAEPAWNIPWAISQQQLIRYVHPDNLLAQDLYGRCQNGRPYFMSAGPDMKYGFKYETPARPSESMADYQKRVEATLEDNLYSYEGVKGTHNTSQAFFADSTYR